MVGCPHPVVLPQEMPEVSPQKTRCDSPKCVGQLRIQVTVSPEYSEQEHYSRTLRVWEGPLWMLRLNLHSRELQLSWFGSGHCSLAKHSGGDPWLWWGSTSAWGLGRAEKLLIFPFSVELSTQCAYSTSWSKDPKAPFQHTLGVFYVWSSMPLTSRSLK